MIDANFWSKVKVTGKDDCWEWMTGKFSTGYGAFKIKGQNRGAHRIAFELVNGPIPSGMMICHHCDNRSCCNPNHLFLGTHGENQKDSFKKGRRSFKGELNHGAKLTQEQVNQIRNLLQEGERGTVIALKYNVKPWTIYAIKHGWRWGAF